jgi:hypothetical protein
MKEPTLEEVNRGIAEFMDWDWDEPNNRVIIKDPVIGYTDGLPYTESLDALHAPILKYFKENDDLTINDVDKLDIIWAADKPAEKVAIELYKAIKELKDEFS